MERKKGEEYWFIDVGLNVQKSIEFGHEYDNIRFKVKNYFHTKEEAEAMAEKIRKVLKGADVIEMPGEEEIKQYADRALYIPKEDRRVHAYEVTAYASGIEKGVEWLKSKI